MTALVAGQVSVLRSGAEILKSVSASVVSGRLTAIVGPNGAGKTTLLHCLAGIEKPKSGSVQLDGRNIHSICAVERGKRVAWVPRPERVPFSFTVRETVMLGRYPHHRGYPVVSDEHAVDAAIAETGVKTFGGRLVSSLSVGELQKVMMARALAGAPEVLLADEPFANLDAGAAVMMSALLRRLVDNGVAVAVSMHDLALARDVADDVVLLSGGCVLGEGPAKEILEPGRIARAYGVGCSIERLSDGSEMLVVKHGTR